MVIKTNTLKPRCSDNRCNKKLKLTDMECNCQRRYCQLHRLPEDHICSFDFSKKEKEQLKKKLLSEKTIVDKIIRI